MGIKGQTAESSVAAGKAIESGVHFTDGSLAGSAVALQTGVAEGLQITGVVNVDIFPRVGRQETSADAGFL